MRKLILLSFLLLAGCNSLAPIDAAAGLANSLPINFDTNGYYTRRTQPHQKLCEVHVRHNLIKWVPCK